MSLTDLPNNPIPSISYEFRDEQLKEFALQVGEHVAKRIINEIQAPDEPLSGKQICEKYGKTRQTLSKYRKLGKLRYHRIGREIYYFEKELREDFAKF